MLPLQQRHALSRRGAALALLLAASVMCIIPIISASDHVRHLLQSPTEFPPGCICERTLDNGAYRLVYDESASTPIYGFRRYCFNIEEAECNKNSNCCDPSQGVYKVELDVLPTCKTSLKRVTVNGFPYTAWEYNTVFNTLRVTRLNLTQTTASGTQICLHLKSNSTCTSLAQLCTYGNGACKYALFNTKRDCCPVGVANLPPPPPPQIIVPGNTRPLPPSPPPPAPPRSEFPNCVCESDPLASRLYVKPTVTVTPMERNLTGLCFTVGVRSVCPKPNSQCCNFTIYKLEFEADAACMPAFSYSTVGGVRRTRIIQYNPYPVMKVTGLDLDMSAAADLDVCLVMKPQCNTLAALGKFHDGSITLGIFNKPGSKPSTCCPLSYVNE
ncbi:hypothetical protein Vretimale_6406 [Volvox reticuliferus]|uniref:Pherophorin domain-containing protein n=1 Tax=Volvox reticuliferus TaxID=1737510 RepID=A0A8J4G7L8_9CHLO|nr:hypothetical protein Vretifemale_16084 [Volvox reticuliferus]GIM01621.1 hypothetical protein Vretimale_6406 [Volvox reticuliferus]